MSINGPRALRVICTEPGARQSEAASCDINTIMARYEKTGMLPLTDREAFFADVSEMGDYRAALENVRFAETFFATLPAKVRAQFNNDVATFLDFTSDERNHDAMVEMGLIEAGAAGAVVPSAEPSLLPDGVSPPA